MLSPRTVYRAVANRLAPRVDSVRDRLGRRSLERYYRREPLPIAPGAARVIVCEGMWDNPNHWLRLWMFLRAALSEMEADVIGVLRRADDGPRRRSLEALGVRRFVSLEESGVPRPDDLRRADALLAGVASADDLLNLELPDGIPAYTFFDTVVKLERHPQPTIHGNPVWRNTLAELLRFGDLYRDLFDRHDVASVVSSHPWKSEWASLCWTALQRKVPFYYMTAHYESVRIRKLAIPDDYKAPNEHLPFAEFAELAPSVQDALVERGRTYLETRFAGGSGFIVDRYAIKPELRARDRAAVVRQMGLDPEKPLVVVYAHSWFDFPHAQDMKNFTDPLDWIAFTIDAIRPLTHVNWALKAHPCDRWYGTLRLADLVTGLAPHVGLVPDESDTVAIQSAAEALVTIHGSIALEGAAAGKAIICGDRSTYSDWGFTHTATSRKHYARLLEDVLSLARPTPEQSRRALAFAATALAPPPEDARYLKLPCDTLYIEGALYPRVRRLLASRMPEMAAEIATLRRWLHSSHHSYNVWRTVEHYTRMAGAAR